MGHSLQTSIKLKKRGGGNVLSDKLPKIGDKFVLKKIMSIVVSNITVNKSHSKMNL